MAKNPQAPRSESPNTITRGFKYPFEPNKTQLEYFAKNRGCVRYVFNQIIAWFEADRAMFKELVKTQPGCHRTSFNRSTVNYLLTTLKEFTFDDNGNNWLEEASSVALQQSAFHALNSIKRYLNGTSKFPKFKSKYYAESLSYTHQAFGVTDDRLRLQKLKEPIRFNKYRELPSAPSNATISKESDGNYYVSFTCTFVPTLRKHGTKALGIDVGITHLATLSDGTTIENPKFLEKSLTKLNKAKVKLSKLPKGSKNYNYQRLRVASNYKHGANQRRNYLHQITSKLVSESQALVVEDVDVGSMLGNNRHLSSRIMDTGFGMFKDFITYKVLETESCHLFIAHAYFPSTQMCSTCCHIPTEKIPLKVRSWTCSECGTTHARDDNASINLLHIAESQLNSPYFDAAKKIHLTNSYGTLIC